MISFARYSGSKAEQATVCSAKTYTLWRHGLYKTCNKAMAIALLKEGNWYDKTKYQPNEEVLNYEQDRQLRLRLRDVCGQSETSSERQESQYQHYQLDTEDSSGKKYAGETVRSGSTISEVKKKRGRPKRVVN